MTVSSRPSRQCPVGMASFRIDATTSLHLQRARAQVSGPEYREVLLKTNNGSVIYYDDESRDRG